MEICTPTKIHGCTLSTNANYNEEENFHVYDSCYLAIKPVVSTRDISIIRAGPAQLNISIFDKGSHSLRFYDVAGNQVLVKAGKGPRNYDLKNALPQGIYFLKIRTKNTSGIYRVMLF